VALIERRSAEASVITKQVPDLWSEQQSSLEKTWDERWIEIAPGSELLEAVWNAHGGRFDKGRDGPQIAIEMNAPPNELEHAVRTFLG
jgi:hypothetical protein